MRYGGSKLFYRQQKQFGSAGAHRIERYVGKLRKSASGFVIKEGLLAKAETKGWEVYADSSRRPRRALRSATLLPWSHERGSNAGSVIILRDVWLKILSREACDKRRRLPQSDGFD